MTFLRYQHLERIDSSTVENIIIGKCHIFPKLDGANGSIWFDGRIRCGSRNRELDTINPENRDNAGFCQWVVQQECFKAFSADFPNHVLYGEWLVPHSLLTYQESAWKQFYVFDVVDTTSGRYLSYEEYQPILEKYEINYIPCQVIIENPTIEQLTWQVQKNVYLIQEGKGYGEGIVVKNYDYTNKFGHQIWAKMIANAFKGDFLKAMPTNVITSDAIESVIVEKYVTKHLVDKTIAKIKNEKGSWESKYIPILLGLVWYDFITEELWNVLKDFKNPKIDFSYMRKLTIAKIKQLQQGLL